MQLAINNTNTHIKLARILLNIMNENVSIFQINRKFLLFKTKKIQILIKLWFENWAETDSLGVKK